MLRVNDGSRMPVQPSDAYVGWLLVRGLGTVDAVFVAGESCSSHIMPLLLIASRRATAGWLQAAHYSPLPLLIIYCGESCHIENLLMPAFGSFLVSRCR